jgi:hypothetical protein
MPPKSDAFVRGYVELRAGRGNIEAERRVNEARSEAWAKHRQKFPVMLV